MKLDVTHYPAMVERLADANAFVEACAGRFGLDEGKQFGALLALEEAFVNICRYAYPDSSGEVEVACGREGGSFVLEIADWGSPFDVLSLPEPDITLDIIERPIGGLGIHFIRVMTDCVSYRREDGRNVLRMEFAAAA